MNGWAAFGLFLLILIALGGIVVLLLWIFMPGLIQCGEAHCCVNPNQMGPDCQTCKEGYMGNECNQCAPGYMPDNRMKNMARMRMNEPIRCVKNPCKFPGQAGPKCDQCQAGYEDDQTVDQKCTACKPGCERGPGLEPIPGEPDPRPCLCAGIEPPRCEPGFEYDSDNQTCVPQPPV